MHRTTVSLAEPVLRQAKLKALQEGLTVSEAIRELLAYWVAGEIELGAGDCARERQVDPARAARGMWADRDPDTYLAASREGLAHSRPGVSYHCPNRLLSRADPRDDLTADS